MIRVPRRKSVDRIIPIMFDAKVSAVEKAMQETYESMGVNAAEVQQVCQGFYGTERVTQQLFKVVFRATKVDYTHPLL